MSAQQSPETVRVAVTQAEPEWLDLDASVKKTCSLIEEASLNGAKLVTFPELFIPGYPAWIWSRPLDPALNQRYIKNSLEVESTQMKLIQTFARENNIAVALGFSEHHHKSLYISQCTINEAGEIVMRRRKLMPLETAAGILLTMLSRLRLATWDSWLAGSTYSRFSSTTPSRRGRLSTWQRGRRSTIWRASMNSGPCREMVRSNLLPKRTFPLTASIAGCRNLSRTYAIESQSFVLHTTTVLGQKGIDLMGTSSGALMNRPGGGSSAIYGPDGRQMSKDVLETDQTIIYADLNPDDILNSKAFVDTVGHYSRPDLLWLGVDKREKLHCRGE